MTAEFTVGQSVGDYEVLSILGLGGMGKASRRAAAPSGLTFARATMWTSSPSNLRTPLTLAPHSRIARSEMASKTGCRSVGELLMTLRTSAVAVCCSSDSVT